MISADMLFDQDFNYIYFSIGNQHFTWIDHILIPTKDMSDVLSCRIVPLTESNVSDHLPVSMHMLLRVPSHTSSYSEIDASNDVPSYPPPNWSDKIRNAEYKRLLAEKLSSHNFTDLGYLMWMTELMHV